MSLERESCECFGDRNGCVYKFIDFVGRDTNNLPRRIRKGKDEALDCPCGVKYGKVHHIGCPHEKCPRCRRILGCDCNSPVDWIRD